MNNLPYPPVLKDADSVRKYLYRLVTEINNSSAGEEYVTKGEHNAFSGSGITIGNTTLDESKLQALLHLI